MFEKNTFLISQLWYKIASNCPIQIFSLIVKLNNIQILYLLDKTQIVLFTNTKDAKLHLNL